MEQTDSELVARYKAGEVVALEELVERHRRPLFGFILNMSGGTVEADEIFQEVWFRAIKKLNLYRQRNFRGWLVRIAHNLIIDRSRKRKPELSLDVEQPNGFRAADVIPGKGRDPSEEAACSQLHQNIAAAVTELPADQKEVFLLRTRMDLSFKEIAGVQKVSINTALARMQYALAKLRILLKGDYEDLTG